MSRPSHLQLLNNIRQHCHTKQVSSGFLRSDLQDKVAADCSRSSAGAKQWPQGRTESHRQTLSACKRSCFADSCRDRYGHPDLMVPKRGSCAVTSANCPAAAHGLCHSYLFLLWCLYSHCCMCMSSSPWLTLTCANVQLDAGPGPQDTQVTLQHCSLHQ